jgi:hypothetical protein
LTHPYNDILEVNLYKNIIIDLFFLDIPELAHKSISLDVLFGQVIDKTQLTPYSIELNELNKMGYGFEYFGKKSMSLLFPLYYKAFYKNITLYQYKDKYSSLSQILLEYSKNKIDEYSENTRYSTFLSNKIENYSTILSKFDNLTYKDLNLINEVFIEIQNDSSIIKLQFECTDFVSPLDYKELNN